MVMMMMLWSAVFIVDSGRRQPELGGSKINRAEFGRLLVSQSN
jgi:hypothetical protein